MSTPISGLDLAALINSVDQVAIEQAGETKRAPLGDIFAALGGGEVIENENGIAVRFSNGIQIAASQGSESWSDAISRFSLGATQSMAGVNYVVREGVPPTYAAPFSSVVALQLQGGRPRASDTEWVRIGSVRPSEVWAEQSPGFDSSVFVRWNYIAIGTWDNE